MRENICTQCHVNNLARTESFWVFSPGFSSLINNISNIEQSNCDLQFSQHREYFVCPSNRTLIDHGLPSVFQLLNVYAHQCVGASVGLCTRHNLCRTDHIPTLAPTHWQAKTDCEERRMSSSMLLPLKLKM